MPSNPALTHLNHLLDTNKNAEATYRAAAEDVKNSELETLFVDHARQHAKFASELREEIKHLGGDSSDSGTLDSALHRGWTDLKAAISGHSAHVILSSCANAEQSAESIYLDAAEAHPTGQIHKLIEKHLQQIKQIRTRLARLEGEMKHGVQFQKNE